MFEKRHSPSVCIVESEEIIDLFLLQVAHLPLRILIVIPLLFVVISPRIELLAVYLQRNKNDS